MKTVREVSALIQQGRRLFLAGSEQALVKLPRGEWIAGTIPYFMTDKGGVITHDLIQVTELPSEVINVSIKSYKSDDIHQLPQCYYSNGFSFIVIPAFTDVHQVFAKECTMWPSLFNQPLTGWVSGVDLKDSQAIPKVLNGKTGELILDEALVMHVELQKNKYAKANIINIFKQGSGDIITFPTPGFEADIAFVNGKEVRLAKYLKEKSIDLQLPLVANYLGAMINVSFRDVQDSNGKVRFYAPVFPDVEYRVAKPVSSYEVEFQSALDSHKVEKPLFTCNCILNFIYANLEGKKTDGYIGAMTFGEIAYMLLNQTMVYITVEDR